MKPVRYKRMFGGTRMIMKKHSLAGTCGIPTDAQRIYIPVDANGADDPDHGPSDPVTIHWPDGRSWKVESIYSHQEFGRAIFGNLCVRYDVCVARQRKTVWWEHGDWFVERGGGMAVMPE